jgi:molybdate transport system substrate-binding protein
VHRRSFIRLVGAFAAGAIIGSARAQAPSMLVFAAASLKNALDAIAAAWRNESGGMPTISYAASSSLAKQIENGAPAELFISADRTWMDYLQHLQLIDRKSRVDLLGNALVLIAPKDSPIRAAIAPGFPLAALLDGGRLAMADPGSVPAGIYGKAALTRLGVWQAVADRVAAAPNVRAALLLVARGEAPLGIVYRTDAVAEPGVKIVDTFPADSHPPIVYPMALTAAASPGAAAFADFLRGPAARGRFMTEGFSVLDRAP